MSRTPSDQNVSLSVWVYGFCEPDKFCWYSIDLGQHEVSRELKRPRIDDVDLLSHGPVPKEIGKIIEPILVTHSKQYSFVVVALDHSIYTLGGTDPYVIPFIAEPYIQCLDTNHVDKGWKQYTMDNARIRPQVAGLDGKIYIFGGDEGFDESVSPSAEVLDPLTGKVEKLPKGYEDNYNLLGVDCVLKRIVFLPYISHHVTEQEASLVFFYYPVIKAWKEESHPALVNSGLQYYACATHAVVGSIIYWFSDFQVEAYDFVNRKLYYSSVVEDLPGYPHDWEYAFRLLFHMSEDYFCLFGLLTFVDDLKYRQIHCTKLRISNCNTNSKLTVSVLDTQTYLIEGSIDFHVMSALLVQVTFGLLDQLALGKRQSKRSTNATQEKASHAASATQEKAANAAAGVTRVKAANAVNATT
ncbi:hypothetical protein LguiA_030442 [Lonicera macranthoides]